MREFKCSLCNQKIHTFWKLDMSNIQRKGSMEMHLFLCIDCAERFALTHDYLLGTINIKEFNEAL